MNIYTYLNISASQVVQERLEVETVGRAELEELQQKLLQAPEARNLHSETRNLKPEIQN